MDVEKRLTNVNYFVLLTIAGHVLSYGVLEGVQAYNNTSTEKLDSPITHIYILGMCLLGTKACQPIKVFLYNENCIKEQKRHTNTPTIIYDCMKFVVEEN